MKQPSKRSSEAKELASPKYHQRVVPDKRKWPSTKREEENRAWAEHAAWKKQEGTD